MKTRIVLEGLCFPEGPRWHEGRLWFSDMHAHQVLATTPDGESEVVAEVPEQPSGLGWLPDGRLLVVSMRDRRLLRQERDGRLVEHADLSQLAAFHCNDMVVGPQGHAYVGNFGWDLHADPTGVRATNLALVLPDGRARNVAEGLVFPNGSVITADGSTLVVGESFGMRLSAFPIHADASLGERRLFASLPGRTPDGICLDAEGAVWVTSPETGEVLRVRAGGDVTDVFEPELRPFACMLGGPERRTLYLCTAETHEPEPCRAKRTGRIEAVEVAVPGAGWP